MKGWRKKGNPWDDWMEVVDDGTRLFARLIRAKKDEVCPTYAVSAALSSVMSCLDFSNRNKIVVTDIDFPATTSVMVAQARRGCRIETIPSRNGMVALEAYEKAIDEKTLMVLVNQVSSLNGFRQDTKAIAELAHAKGAMVFVDAYQTAGNSVIDIRKVDADFLAAGTQKYLLGIPGSAFLYVREDLIQSLEPTFTGWFSQKDPYQFGRTRPQYVEDANRFQIGTWSVASHYAARAGMKIILEVGDQAIQEHISKLTGYLLERLPGEGLSPLNEFSDKQRGAFVSVIVPEPHELEEKLRERRVHTSARREGLRLAFHFFNKTSDADAALDAIKRVISSKQEASRREVVTVAANR
jgi:selenocysteine lyase/cysteine desulfurase